VRLLPALVVLVLAGATPASAATTFVALTPGDQLVGFDRATPGDPSAPVAITGLQGSEDVLGIDFRPATGQMYGVTSAGQVYVIDPATGAATAVGTPGFVPSGITFGVDFDPTADRLRVVSDSRQNVLIDPVSGSASPGPDLYPGDPRIGGLAYGAGALYGIDYNALQLFTLNGDSGLLTPAGPLTANPGPLFGFDIDQAGNGFFIAGFGADPGKSYLHKVNLANGGSPSAGEVPVEGLHGLAIAPATGGDGGGGGTGGGAGGAEPLDLDRLKVFEFIRGRSGTVDRRRVSVLARLPEGLVSLDLADLFFKVSVPAGGGSAVESARAKRTLIARGKATLRGGQRKKVKLPLTRAGKRFLRGYERKRLRVTVTLRVRYRPAAGAVQTRTFPKARLTLDVKRPRR
jgi:Domain of unknown function (DUF4394)